MVKSNRSDATHEIASHNLYLLLLQSSDVLATHALLHAFYLLILIIATMVQHTPSVAWLLISRRPPVESYRGVAVSVGGLGTAENKDIKFSYTTSIKSVACLWAWQSLVDSAL